MCTLNEDLKNEALFLYGNFNPFCKDGKDPVVQSRPGKNEKRKTTLDNGGIAHAHSWAVISLVVSVCVARVLSSLY